MLLLYSHTSSAFCYNSSLLAARVYNNPDHIPYPPVIYFHDLLAYLGPSSALALHLTHNSIITLIILHGPYSQSVISLAAANLVSR